jgi:RNA polymerase primary sigma factor
MKDTVRLMAESVRLLSSREEVMRAFTAGDFEALGRHYYALALKEAFSRFHLLGDEALDLAQEIAAHIDRTLKAWREGKRKLQLNSKNLTFWVMVEVDRAVREYFYRTRGVGYTNSRLIARIRRVVEELQADGREPTPEEIAGRLEVPVEVVEEALAMAEAEDVLSLDDTTEEGTRYEEFVVGDDPREKERESDAAFLALEEAIDRYRLREKLGAREAELLDRFMAGESVEEEELESLAVALQKAMSKAAVA